VFHRGDLDAHLGDDGVLACGGLGWRIARVGASEGEGDEGEDCEKARHAS